MERLCESLLALGLALFSTTISMAYTKQINPDSKTSLNKSHKTIDSLTIHFIETSDVHGCFFPYDFINGRQKLGSLARVMTYVNSMRQNPYYSR